MMMPSVCDAVRCGYTIHPTATVSEQVNRKCPPRNNILKLSSSPYTDHERSKTSLRPIMIVRMMHRNKTKTSKAGLLFEIVTK